jgi:carboxymethylenebutenolidase
VKEYPGVGHGFMNDHDPADITRVFAVLARISHTRFDARDGDAWKRIAGFLDAHLKS